MKIRYIEDIRRANKVQAFKDKATKDVSRADKLQTIDNPQRHRWSKSQKTIENVNRASYRKSSRVQETSYKRHKHSQPLKYRQNRYSKQSG